MSSINNGNDAIECIKREVNEIKNASVILKQETRLIRDMLNDVILNNRSLKKNIQSLTDENKYLHDSLYDMEVHYNNLNQYTRRNNIEITNISEKITQRSLEEYVLKVMKSLDVNIVSYDLVAVHRLGKFVVGKNRNVIVRFVNRKNAFTCLRNLKKLNSSNTPEYRKLYIVENLCPSYRKIFNYLYKMKKEQKNNNVWSYNGNVFFKKSPDDNDIDYFLDTAETEGAL